MDPSASRVTTVNITSRITAPVTWISHPRYKVQDLREEQYDEALEFIKKHYFREEPMCRSSELFDDPESVESYLDLMKSWLKDTLSVIAISNKSRRIIGVLIIRYLSRVFKSDTFDRVLDCKGECLQAIMELRRALVEQANIYEFTGCDSYLCASGLVVHTSYKNKGLEVSLIEAFNKLSLSIKVPFIAGIFTSTVNQEAAAKLGFTELTRIDYNQWLDDGEVIFEDPGIGNYSAAFMINMLESDSKAIQ